MKKRSLHRRYGHARRKYHIGDVAVTPWSWDNPYKTVGNPYAIGDERVRALRAFHDGEAHSWPGGILLWYAPSSGGAKRITAKQVDWSGLRGR